MLRVRAYIDGHNLYHAILRFSRPELKWVDLWALSQIFVPPRTGVLVGVHYFSAFADWLPEKAARHRTYVAALESVGVTVHLARFKRKHRWCPNCQTTHIGHEEKETDVHMALSLLEHARQDVYDRALIVTRDSDLVPAARVTKAAFPDKDLRAVAPPHLGHSNEMLATVDGKHKIQQAHLERSLLPATLITPTGDVISRPLEYKPSGPSGTRVGPSATA